MAQCGRSLRCNSCSMCFASVFTHSCARQRLQCSYRLSATIPIALLLVRPVISLVQNTRICLSGAHSDFLCRASPHTAMQPVMVGQKLFEANRFIVFYFQGRRPADLLDPPLFYRIISDSTGADRTDTQPAG